MFVVVVMGTLLLVALAIFLMAVLLSKFRHRYQRYKYKRKCRGKHKIYKHFRWLSLLYDTVWYDIVYL